MRAICVLAALLLLANPLAFARQILRQGDAVDLAGVRATLTRLDALPYVESDYTKRHRFDSHDNPKLHELRQRYRLDEVVAPGTDEFEKQVLLLDWANHRIQKFGRPTSDARGALKILEANEAGHTFFCAHYADLFVSAAASMGWIARPMALRRPDQIGQGSTEHSSTEIWSNQHRRWIMFDPTFAMYVEKDGLKLNAFELRQEWFYRDGRDLTFVLDKEQRRYRKSDLPIFRNRFPGFGDLALDPSALNVYAFIGYVPNTDLMDRGLDYARMFITKDALCDATKWHTRINPEDPARDPYFPINQSALSLSADGRALRASLKTLTPNFKHYLARFDGGDWRPAADSFDWTLHAGLNRLEVKTVNHFGVDGPISTAEVTVANAPVALEPIRDVKIGAHRQILVNGKPFFPIGSWVQSSSRYPLLRELGFNTFIGARGARDAEQAARAGGYVMCGFNEALKSDPSLLAWTHSDEPDLGIEKGNPRKPAPEVVSAYQRIRALDSTRPIFLNLTSYFMDRDTRAIPADRRPYYDVVVNGADVLCFDVYPIYGWNRPDKLTWVADGVKLLREQAGPDKPVFAFIETSKGSRWISYERQIDVKPEHTRAEVWMAIIRGATGIAYFTHAWRPEFTEFAPTDDMRSELKRLNEQITRLAPAILAPASTRKVTISIAGGLPCDILAKEHEGALYLFANNLDMDNREGAATIRVEGLRRGSQIEVIDENRAIVAEEGHFPDHFDPLGVHLYRIIE